MQPAHPGIAVWTVGALLAVGLLVLAALTLVATVLIASRHSLEAWQKLKAALAVLVWVVPAGALIVYIAQRSDQHFAVRAPAQVVTAAVGPATAVTPTARPVSHTMPVSVELDQTAPRLSVRQISSDDPRWGDGTSIVNGRELKCVTSQRFATLAEAEEQITERVLHEIRAHYRNEFPIDGQPARLLKLVDELAIKDAVGEVIDKYDFGNGITGKMYRAHVRLDFSPQLHDALSAQWRSRTVEQRIGIVGGLLGLATLMLGTAAAYFRLDDATGARYQKRLKLAAALVVAAGGLATMAMIG